MSQMEDETRLLAYLDGELGAEGVREVEAAIAARPEVLERLERLRELRILSRDAMRRETPRVGRALRERIKGVMSESADETGADLDVAGGAVLGTGVARESVRMFM